MAICCILYLVLPTYSIPMHSGILAGNEMYVDDNEINENSLNDAALILRAIVERIHRIEKMKE